jgi:hypothetical protein
MGKTNQEIATALKCDEADIKELMKRIIDEGDKDVEMKLNIAMFTAEQQKKP